MRDAARTRGALFIHGSRGAIRCGRSDGLVQDASASLDAEFAAPKSASAARSASKGAIGAPLPSGPGPMAPRWATRRADGSHAATTNPDARLFRKESRVSPRSGGPSARRTGTGALLGGMGLALMENRTGHVVQAKLTRAERRKARHMVHRHSPGSIRHLSQGAEKGFDSAGLVADLRRAPFLAEAIPRIVS